MNVARELMADERDLLRDRVEYLMAQCGVAGRNQAEDGYKDEQQREQGDEARVREVGDKHPAVVIAVLLDNPEHEC
jgi:hypothetical protein